MDKKIANRVVAKFQLEAMSNLRPEDTGVKGVVIWVSSGEFAGSELQHGPRIKVVQSTKLTSSTLQDSVTVKLIDPPEVIDTLPVGTKAKVINFVNANRDVLLRYWRLEISTPEMVRSLRSV